MLPHVQCSGTELLFSKDAGTRERPVESALLGAQLSEN